jgi:hypothetical protein
MLRVMQNSILDVGKSGFVPAEFEFAPEPELGICPETHGKETDVKMATIKEKEEVTVDGEWG